MSDLKQHITRIHLLPDGEPIFDDHATVIEIADEAAGEYVRVSQHADGCGAIAIDPGEWAAIRDAIDQMIARCRV